MVHIIAFTLEGDTVPQYIVVDNILNLPEVIGKLEGIGKQKTIILYEAEQVGYKFTLEDKAETVITKIPKVDILK